MPIGGVYRIEPDEIVFILTHPQISGDILRSIIEMVRRGAGPHCLSDIELTEGTPTN